MAAALAAYLAARQELFALEAKDAAGRVALRGAGLVAIVVLAVSAYLMLVVGIVGALAAWTTLGWYTIALLIAGVQLLIAAIFGWLVTRPLPAVFPLTREEFKKDKSWLQALRNRANRS